MKTLKNVIQIASGWIKKYDFVYDVDGKEYHYDVVSRNKIEGINLPYKINAVAIIPLFEDGDILMIKEFRYTVNDYVYAFPAGLIDDGETSVQAAIRELREETGLTVTKIIAEFPGGYSSEGMSDELLSTIVCKVNGNIKETTGLEETHPIKVSIDKAKEIAFNPNNKISNKIQLFLAGLLV